ncbi:MAG: sigma-70 family RNA polymerase sigma factor [Myxococcota bacterium]
MAANDLPEVLERFHAELELVSVIARSLYRRLGYPVEFDDLVSAGREGLLDAARRFEPESGTPFHTFARYRVRGAMLDSARRYSTLSRRVRHQLAAERAALSVQESLTARPSTIGSVTLSTEAALAQQLTAMATAAGLVIESAEGREVPAAEPSPEQALTRAELLGVVRQAVDDLDPEEAQVIRRHYFNEEHLEDIAADLGMSKPWATRLHLKALSRLSKLLSDEG